MNTFAEFIKNNNKNYIAKYEQYLDVYERHLSKYKGKTVTIIEFGVNQGGSLNMWKEYLGKGTIIYGVDINPNCAKLTSGNIEILIGDQEDRNFLEDVAKKIGEVDIVVDDGGHSMAQQINTFEVIFPCLKNDGVYICEDLHTSYWKSHGGGYKKRNSFVEYSKNFIDMLNAWNAKRRSRLKVSEFTKTVNSIHYYDSVIVLEKGKHEKLRLLESGEMMVELYSIPKKNILKRLWKKIIR